MNDLSSVDNELLAGSTFDRFTVDKKIGEGGMAVLYLATDKEGDKVVLKIPRQDSDVDPVSMIAFENELRLAPYLQDFPLAYMPKVQTDIASQPYLVMDYIEGVDLWTHLTDNGCMSEDEAISLMKKIAYAVSELHKRHIVHLDLKLSNIMVTTDGEIRLIDFGLANHTELPDLIYESFHDPKGTPTYIAPEQFIGIRDEPRSDIFSLGVMLFEMTTNEIPFGEGCTEFDVIKRIRKKITLPSEYNKELSQTFDFVVGMCLNPNPDIRFMDAEHFIEILNMWEGEVPVDSIMGFNKKNKSHKNKPTSLLKPAYRALKNIFTYDADHFDRIKKWAKDHRAQKGEKTNRIIVALNMSENNENDALNVSLIREAYFLSKLCLTNITLLTIVSQDVGMANGEKEMRELNKACNIARKKISCLAEIAGESPVSMGINVRYGNVVDTINACIEFYDADVLLIGSRKRHALSHYMKNNDGQKILSSANCNIHIVKEGKGMHLGQMDKGEDDSVQAALALVTDINPDESDEQAVTAASYKAGAI